MWVVKKQHYSKGLILHVVDVSARQVGVIEIEITFYGRPHDRNPFPTGTRESCNLTVPNIGALIIRIGFWGPLYYNYIKESQNSIVN